MTTTSTPAPEDTPDVALYAVHVLGVDEYHPAPSYGVAVAAARRLNEALRQGGHPVACMVSVWPFARARHAAELTEAA